MSIIYRGQKVHFKEDIAIDRTLEEEDWINESIRNALQKAHISQG